MGAGALGPSSKCRRLPVPFLVVTDIEIKPSRYGAPTARVLVAAALADLGKRYGGEGDETPVEAIEFDPPGGAFVIAWRGSEPVGCGGWRMLSHRDADDVAADVAEIKRMYTDPAARGRGVATMVLRALEESARESGLRRVVMECGDRQPEAIALYEKCGYERIPNYGFYAHSPSCVSFGRDL